MAVGREKRLRVFERDGYRCRHCGFTTTLERLLEMVEAARHGAVLNREELLTADHIWPRALGGTDEETNLQTLCAPCNEAKGAKPPHGLHHEARKAKHARPPERRVRQGRLIVRKEHGGFASIASRLHLPGCDPVFGCVAHCPVRGTGYPT